MSAPRRFMAAALVASAVLAACSGARARPAPPDGVVLRPPDLDVPYEPTSPEVVQAMLDLGEVRADDVVYDLGCGDGRIVVAAAQRGARAVGVDLDPDRVVEARANVRAAGLEPRAEIRQGDLFAAKISDATVVMLYLWPQVNLRLRPKLLAELRPGTRVVSHSHDMGDWAPERVVDVAGARLYRWTIPGR